MDGPIVLSLILGGLFLFLFWCFQAVCRQRDDLQRQVDRLSRERPGWGSEWQIVIDAERAEERKLCVAEALEVYANLRDEYMKRPIERRSDYMTAVADSFDRGRLVASDSIVRQLQLGPKGQEESLHRFIEQLVCDPFIIDKSM